MFWFIKRREQHSTEELEGVKEDALGIIKEAHKKAEQIVRETHFFTRKVEADLKKSLEGTVAHLADQSHTRMEGIAAAYEKDLMSVSKKIEEAALKELEAYAAQTQKNLAESQKQISALVALKEKELDKALSQAYDAKSAQMVKYLNDEISSVTKSILGKVISLEEHEQIVLNRLAELKKSEPWN